MILGFKKQFEAPILEGTKIHTIREDSPDRWGAGQLIHFATGSQTKNYNCFKEGQCISTERVFMTFDYMLHVSIGLRELYMPEKKILANNDGFKDLKEFEDWFYPIIAKSEKKCFSGKIIHWTDLRYGEGYGKP